MYDAVRVPPVRARSRAVIEARAELSLSKVAPQCLVDPQPTPVTWMFDTVLPRRGVWTASVEELAPGLEGITDCVGKEVKLAPHVYDGMDQGNGRCRFSGAHELGHVVLHADELAARAGVLLVNGGDVLLARRSDLKPFLDPEWQANTYAGALLMPAAMVRKAMAGLQPYQMVATVVNTFQVSKEAAECRLHKLGLLWF
jgi:hypothetical protein